MELTLHILSDFDLTPEERKRELRDKAGLTAFCTRTLSAAWARLHLGRDDRLFLDLDGYRLAWKDGAKLASGRRTSTTEVRQAR